MEPVLSARQVFKTYGRGRKRVEALKGVSFDVLPGTVTGLIGPNGAGKSTLIKSALGFFGVTSGELQLLGNEPGSPHSLKRLGYLPENPSFPQYLSGREFLTYAARLHGLPGRSASEKVDELLDEVGILHAADRRVRSYSKGMAQRLGLAQAMIASPDLLILDEPMSGLDPLGRAQVKAMLRRRQDDGTSIIFCSHILDDVERLCEDLIMLAGGEVRHQGNVNDVLLDRGQGWETLIRCASLADLLAPIDWTAAGDGLWSATGLTREQANLVAVASTNGDVEILRLGLQKQDLEQLFLQLAGLGVDDA